MGGAFQTSRDIFQNPIWQDIPKFRIFFYIVGNAIFSKDGVRIGDIHLNRGQYLRSYRNLADDLQYIENRKVKKYSISVISRKIDQLVKEERLKIESTELGTLFTVVNYDIYQGFDHYKNKELGTVLEQCWNGDGTVLEQSGNNNNNVNNVSSSSSSNSRELPENFFLQNIRRKGFSVSPFERQLIEQLENQYGYDLLMAAMKVTAKNGADNINYVEGVLTKWEEAGVKSIEQAREFERQFKERTTKRKGTAKGKQTNVFDELERMIANEEK